MHLVERHESIWKLLGTPRGDARLRDGVPSKTGRGFEASIGVIRAPVDRIAEITASHEHIAIGSDFDGFIKPPMAGLESMSDLAGLEEQLVNEYGDLDAERMCSGNVPRVLQTGWGRRLAV